MLPLLHYNGLMDGSGFFLMKSLATIFTIFNSDEQESVTKVLFPVFATKPKARCKIIHMYKTLKLILA